MPTVSLPVVEATQVGDARRTASALAGSLGFDEAAVAKIALAVTEAATNLAKYAAGGELLLNTVEADGHPVLEIMALDKGPGMPNVTATLRDGYSTSGSPGFGLGALRRLAPLFDIYSGVARGTAVLCRFWAGPPAPGPRPEPLQVGAVNVPHRGETVCGDAWAVRQDPEYPSVMVADGLGHGPAAAEASSRAVAAFRAAPPSRPQEHIERIHAALRATRGAAVAVAEIDRPHGVVRYAGVGNVSGLVAGLETSRSMVSQAGIVGHETRRIQEFTYDWPPGSLLVMYSDGLTSDCSPNSYPGLRMRDPSLVAGMLYRSYTRGRDDATVVVARDMV